MPGTSTIPSFSVAALPVAQVVPVLFFLIFFVWAIYTLVASFHWFKYSNSTSVALTAIIVHVIVSAWLAIYAVSGIH